jgi:DNA end-binding protein Ku
MLDLAKHIVTQKTSTFDPAKFEDHYDDALTELIKQKQAASQSRLNRDQRATTLSI